MSAVPAGSGGRPARPPLPASAWAIVLVFLGGCSSGPQIPTTSPLYGSSLPPYDALVRHHLMAPDDDGVDALRRAPPRDDVVRLLNEGLMLRRAGRREESNAALQRAEAIATARYTRSIAQDVASLIVSDDVVDYQASALERSMIHYYGALNYLELDNPESALVEARRANALLRRYANDFPDRSFVADAAVQYIAGMVQWGQGEENDAIVSLRQSLRAYEEYEKNYGVGAPPAVAVDAVRIAAAVGMPDVADQIEAKWRPGEPSALDLPARDSEAGDLIVVVENGFIAHKRQQKLFVPVLRSERDAVLAGSPGSAIEAAVTVLIRTVIVMTEMSREGQSYVQSHEDGVTFVSGALSAAGMELITMAWPVYELDARRAQRLRVVGPDGASVEATLLEDLSAIAVRDFEERRTSTLLRMIARTLFKEASVIQSERAGERAAGAVGGFAARIAARTVANATERADTRSWSGLPAELRVARLRLPAGEHDVRVEFDGPRGPDAVTVRARIRPGGVSVVSVPVFGRESGDQNRLRRATHSVTYRAPPRRATRGR